MAVLCTEAFRMGHWHAWVIFLFLISFAYQKKTNPQLFVIESKGFSLEPMMEGIRMSISANHFKWRSRKRVNDNCTV